MSDLTVVEHSQVEVSDAILPRLDLRGLTYKQRRFIFSYQGNAVAAAEAAGYCATYKDGTKTKTKNYYLRRVVSSLMRNEQVQKNIHIMQKEMESFGVLSVAEAKMIISDIARNSDSEARRMEASKLALQWEGQLDPRVRLEIEARGRIEHVIKPSFQFIPPGPAAAMLGIQPEQIEHDETSENVIDAEVIEGDVSPAKIPVGDLDEIDLF